MKIMYIAPNPWKGSKRFTKSVLATLHHKSSTINESNVSEDWCCKKIIMYHRSITSVKIMQLHKFMTCKCFQVFQPLDPNKCEVHFQCIIGVVGYYQLNVK